LVIDVLEDYTASVFGVGMNITGNGNGNIEKMEGYD
jgi:hypothetical protein